MTVTVAGVMARDGRRQRTKRALDLRSLKQALTGAVSVIQRGDSSLRLNVHVHVIALDGVYLRQARASPLVFHALPEPTAEKVAEVAKRTALRVQKILARHGRTLDGTGERDAHDTQPAERPRCSGPMRWIEAATAPDAIARLLAKHGLGPRPPPERSAPLGQLRLAFPKL